MKILTSESLDKSSRTFIEISYAELVKELEEDHGWHETIDMFNPDREVRIFFDVDTYNKDKDDIRRKTLDVLNLKFNTIDSDWAICNGHNNGKISYHILSKKYKCKLSELRTYVRGLDLNWLDYTVYWYDRNEPEDQSYFRLPNQSKSSINRVGAPLVIEQGSIPDFFVGATEGLKMVKL